MMLRRLIAILTVAILCDYPAAAQPHSPLPTLQPLVRVVDLLVGEQADVTLSNGLKARVKLVGVQETRDPICFAVRRADVAVEIDGQRVELVAANYNLPKSVGKVQIDCSITSGNNSNGTASFWGLDKRARIRLWPAGSAWINPGTFQYPAKQKWFAASTQMANEPVYVDGGEKPGERSIYYHSGLDIGGSEGMVAVVAATDGLVVSVAGETLEGHKADSPVSARYDVVYLLDARGWYYRYSHLKEIDKSVALGRVLKMGDPIGSLGKEGGSGGWSHLHFEIKTRQPSGKWGTEEGFAYLWEAYVKEHNPKLIAVARPHHVVLSGDSVTLDGSKSWCGSGKIAEYHWQFGDGTTAKGAQVKRAYETPGRHSETLRVTDESGNVAFDFANVYVFDRENPKRLLPSIHANFSPTFGVKPLTPITFKVRSFGNTFSKEVWNFGDNSPPVEVQSDGNAVQHAADGYAATTHSFQNPGDYVVSVSRSDSHGVMATDHLHVRIESNSTTNTSRLRGGTSVSQSSTDLPQSGTNATSSASGIYSEGGMNSWQQIEPFFAPPEQWKDVLGDFRSPLQFADGRAVTTAEEWATRRAEILAQWHDLMGDWPDLITEPKVEVLKTERRENFQQITIRFRWTPNESTTGYLLIPDGTGKRPGVVTVYYEPETAIGLGAAQRDFALQLARRGFVTLSIGAKEANEAKTFALYYPSLNDAKVQPLSMLAYAAANAWHVLAARPEVDQERIGIVGHSFGGKWAMFASCLFDKFACAAWSDPGIVFDQTRSSVNYWEPWYLGYHPQPWRNRGVITDGNPARGLYPRLVVEGRDLHELHALMAPRPFIVSGGSEDPPRRWSALNHSIAVNNLLGYTNRVAMTNRAEHSPDEQSNAQIYAFFEHFLQHSSSEPKR